MVNDKGLRESKEQFKPTETNSKLNSTTLKMQPNNLTKLEVDMDNSNKFDNSIKQGATLKSNKTN